jgi:AcrR family transcriptional regulator
MRQNSSKVQQHVLEVTAAMLEETERENVHVSAIAERANVGIPTIYYHFDSLSQLIATAQGVRHKELWAPFDDILKTMTWAVDHGDEEKFWTAWDEVFAVGWARECSNGMQQIAEVIIDARRDSVQSDELRKLQEIQLEQRIDVIEKAKSLGWIDTDFDSRTLSLIFWGSFIGLHLHFGSELYDLEAEDAKKIFTKILRGQRDQTVISPH